MPIQVPTINRAPVQQPQSVGRIDFNPVDASKAQEVQSSAIERLGKTAIETYDRVQKQTADVYGTEAANDYHTHLIDSLNATKAVKGDPTKTQEEYFLNAKKKYDEISNRYADASDIVKSEIKKKLDATGVSFYDRASTSFAAQTNTYQSKVTNEAVELAKNAMMDATASLDISDPQANVPLENKIKEIINLRQKQGLRNGTATEVLDPNGEIDPVTGKTKVIGLKHDDILRQEIAKDLNDGISKAILNLSASGDVNGAEYLKQKYKEYLTPDTNTKIEKATHNEMILQKANQAFAATKGMSEEKAMKYIDNIKDPEVAQKAMATYTDYHARQRRNINESQKANYENLSKYLQNNKNITSVIQLENDPMYKRLIANNLLSSKQVDNLRMRIEQPKTSNTEVKGNIYDLFFSGKFKGMSYEEFDQAAAGLSKSDRSAFETKYRNENSQSPGEQHQQIKRLGTDVTKLLNEAGYVKRNENGKYSNAHYNKITKVQDEMISYFERLGPLSPAEERVRLKEFVANTLKKEAFEPKENSVILKNIPARAAISNAKEISTKKAATELDSKKAFYLKNKRFPNPQELKEFMEKNK